MKSVLRNILLAHNFKKWFISHEIIEASVNMYTYTHISAFAFSKLTIEILEQGVKYV